MPFDNTGTFNRIHSWEQDRIDGISIDSSRVDEDTDDIAEGLSQCMLRDGTMAMGNALNMNNFKIQNLAEGTAATDAVNKGQLDALNVSLNSAITSAIGTMLSSVWPVGSTYMGRQDTCPLAALIAGSTWTKVATKVITNVDSTVAVKGNGKPLGITHNGSTNYSWCASTNSGGVYSSIYRGAYTSSNLPKNVGSSEATATNVAIGVSTNASASGLTGTASSSSITINIWERTA